MSVLQNPSHPIWPLARLVIVMIGLYFILKSNANNFDETELKTILEMFLVTFGAEAAKRALVKRPPNETNPDSSS